MIGIILLLIVGLFVGYLVWINSEPDAPPLDVDPEQAVKAAVELHRIRQNIEGATLKTEQRRDSRRLRREIAEALKDGEGD